MVLYLLIPVASALLGWILCRAFSKYLIHNYLPSKQDSIAISLANAAENFLDKNLDINNRLANPALMEKAMPMVETHIDHFLNVRLKEQIPMLAMFIGTSTTDKVKEVFMEQLKELFPQIMRELAGGLKNDLNISSLIHQKLQEKQVWQKIKGKLGKEISRFKLFGLLAGLFIGLVNVAIIYVFTFI
ncbi:MAG: hypothetical protein QM727_09120 [Niabella sp.]